MSKTAQPAIKPTATTGGQQSDSAGTDASNRRDFFVAAANMSWQLAIVVLVPILVGSRLDAHFHTSPVWTLVGFVLAMIGTGLVVGYQLKKLAPPNNGGRT